MLQRTSLNALRASLLAAMGLGAGACGSVTVEEDPGSGGGAATSASSGTTGGATGGGPTTFECAGATPVLDAKGNDTGFAKCPDGTTHRAKNVACDPTLGVPACTGAEESIQCASDADCTAKPNGRCAAHTTISVGVATSTCGCVYPCTTDADCDADQICLCAGVAPLEAPYEPWAACVDAACASGDDCASGECGLSSYDFGCTPYTALACRDPKDACRLDSECGADNGCAVFFLEDGEAPTWQCLSPNDCAFGRPLTVEGQVRMAGAAGRDDWSAIPLEPDTAGLAAPLREALARQWLEIAALEHASVASFARFTLELLALGAPAHLIAESQQAGLDEVEHAKMAYGLASAYAGESAGPGALNVSGLILATSRRAVIRALVEEACVGETLAVVEAAAAADRSRDPALRRAYARIATDEQRHAELGWKALAWLLGDTDEGLRRYAGECFDAAIAAASREPAERAVTAPEHGLLAAGEIAAARRQALQRVVAPCAAAITGAGQGSAGVARGARGDAISV